MGDGHGVCYYIGDLRACSLKELETLLRAVLNSKVANFVKISKQIATAQME